MRITRIASALAIALAIATPSTGAQGQAQRAISLGVAAGIPIPLGDFKDEVNSGWRALGTLAMGAPVTPLGLRLDAAYDRLGFRSAPIGAAGRSTGAQQIVSVTLNPTYRLASTRAGSAQYLIAGVGPYSISCAGVASCDGVTRFGWNAGAAARFGPGMRWLVEVRYHRVAVPDASVQYLPLTVGMLF